MLRICTFSGALFDRLVLYVATLGQCRVPFLLDLSEPLRIKKPAEQTGLLSAFVSLLPLASAIICCVGVWLAPEIVALLAEGVLMDIGLFIFNEFLTGFCVLAQITLVGLFAFLN